MSEAIYAAAGRLPTILLDRGSRYIRIVVGRASQARKETGAGVRPTSVSAAPHAESRDTAMSKHAFAICERVAEVQALLHDHLECGKHSPTEVIEKANAILSENELLKAMFDVGYFPPTTPPPRMRSSFMPATRSLPPPWSIEVGTESF